MTIKEVEEALGIPRASIRFYEKKNLISPDRGGNAYRDYSEEDVARLKKIIILRKIGISVGDIEEILNDEVPLSEVVEKNILQLQEQIEELNGALRISKEMKGKNEELSSLDENFYWEEIHREEKAGSKFLDIANDILQYEKKVILDEFDLADSEGNSLYGVKESILRAIGCCCLAGGVWFLCSGGDVGDAIEGFFFPFICIIITSIFGLPWYFYKKKHSEVFEKMEEKKREFRKKHPRATKNLEIATVIFGVFVVIALLICMIWLIAFQWWF